MMPTREFVNGKPVMETAKWRCYIDLFHCLADRATFFQKNRRYAKCWQETTGEGWARAVAAAGYATDPEYANKIVAVANQVNAALGRPEVAAAFKADHTGPIAPKTT